ncbi:hypothetical protein K440DRAFT_627436 [Wilcoxina mikolae CBS 423.85]|nr:hypothetical protein K440DRAFT_627436 [Wilcoxina mikolae CBS 423.85]
MTPTPLRPTGHLERWSTVRHKHGYHNAVSLAATSSNPFVPPTVFAALKECIKTYAVLAVTVSDASTLARVERIDLRDIVTWDDVGDRSLEDVLAAEASIGFGDGVAWRLRILRERTAVLSWCHGILDGESGVIVMRTFLSSLSLSPSTDTPTIITPPAIPLTPAIEDLIPLPVSWSLLLKKCSELLLLPWKPRLWTGPRISVVLANTRILLLQFPTEILRKRCREEETSVTAFIHTAIGVSLLRQVPGALGVAGSIAISLRRFLPDAGVLGVMAASVAHCHIRGEEGIWDRARGVKETISQRLAAGTADLNISLLRYAGNLYSFLQGRDGKERELGYGVSNLGMVEGMEGIESLVFSQSAGVAGNALDVGIIGCSGGGEVCVSFQWLEGVLEDAFVKKVREGVKDVVEEAVRA